MRYLHAPDHPRLLMLLAAVTILCLARAVAPGPAAAPSTEGSGHVGPPLEAPKPTLPLAAAEVASEAPEVRLSVAGVHPRLFFSSDDVPSLRAKASDTHAFIWQTISAFARSDAAAPASQFPAEGNLDGFRNAGDRLIVLSFAYVITGDRDYFEAARHRLLTYASWPAWGDEGGTGQRRLGFHHMILGAALAYDWLYNDLSEADRERVGSVLAKRTQESYEASSSPTYVESWGNWWRRAYVQNHHWVNHGALGISALALLGDDPRAEGWLAQAVDQFSADYYLAEGIDDASWHEGLPYQNYAINMSLPFLYNLRRLDGTDLLPHSYLRNYSTWRLYNWLPGTTRFALSYGDFQWSWANAFWPPGILRFVATEYGDERASWLSGEIERSAGARQAVAASPWRVFEFFYYDPDVDARAPAGLPLSLTLSDLEGVIWRTGWGSEDLTFALKTGAYAGRFAFEGFTSTPQRQPWGHPGVDTMSNGHDHDDANTFYLYRGGVDLSSESIAGGFATSYHNTLLVDGAGQYRDPDEGPGFSYWDMDPSPFAGSDGRLELTASSEHYDYLVADATNRYRVPDSSGRPGTPIVDEFRRYVLFVRPGYLVMVDNVRASAPHHYDSVIHFGTSVTVEGEWIKGTAEGNQLLGVKVVAPKQFGTSAGDDGKPYVRIHPNSNVASTCFVTLLYPTSADDWPERPRVSSLGGSDASIGLRVELDGTQDHLIKYGSEDVATVGAYSFDGKFASVSKGPSGDLRRVFLGQGSSLSDENGERVLIQMPFVASAVEASYSGAALDISGGNIVASGAKFYGPGIDPSQVRLNGHSLAATKSGSYVVLP